MWEYGNMRMRKRGNEKVRKCCITAFSHFLILALSYSHILTLHSAPAQPGYTNHAGNMIAGYPTALTATHVTLRSASYPLSIFPESEQRRIATDFGTPRLPQSVKRAIDGAEKAMERSRKRAEKGFCTKEESEAFCAKSSAALRTYLDKQVESGTITPAERKAIGR